MSMRASSREPHAFEWNSMISWPMSPQKWSCLPVENVARMSTMVTLTRSTFARRASLRTSQSREDGARFTITDLSTARNALPIMYRPRLAPDGLRDSLQTFSGKNRRQLVRINFTGLVVWQWRGAISPASTRTMEKESEPFEMRREKTRIRHLFIRYILPTLAVQ